MILTVWYNRLHWGNCSVITQTYCVFREATPSSALLHLFLFLKMLKERNCLCVLVHKIQNSEGQGCSLSPLLFDAGFFVNIHKPNNCSNSFKDHYGLIWTGHRSLLMVSIQGLINILMIFLKGILSISIITKHIYMSFLISIIFSFPAFVHWFRLLMHDEQIFNCDFLYLFSFPEHVESVFFVFQMLVQC